MTAIADARMDNPVRGRLNAAVLRATDSYAHRVLGPWKREILAGLPDTVLEIGPGAGANLRYYRPGTRLIAIEPNRRMHEPLRRAARRHGIDLELRAVGAEAMGLADESIEAVVSTLVLCTVADLRSTLAEIRRVLRPGGTFHFLEHVAAGPAHPALRAVQVAVARPWRWFFEGCDVRRDIEAALAATGWAELTLSRYRVPSLFVPINAQIAGTAVR